MHHFLYCFAANFIVGGISKEQIISDKQTVYGIFAYTPLNLLYNPGIAVDFFFILSSYVLSFTYFLKQDIVIVQQNILKRYVRLAIPVLALCLLLWIFHHLNFIYRNPIPHNDINNSWLPRLLPDYLSFSEVIKYGLWDVFAGNSRYCSVLWTMSIELIGSMLVFVALLITHKIIDKRKKLFILVLLLLLNILRQDVLLSSFVLGMIICFLQLNSKRYLALVSLNYIKIIFIIAGIYLASFPFIQDAALLNTTIYGFIFTKQIANVHEYFYVTGCSLILITALNSSKLKPFFSSKPFSFLGKISFGLYLIHLPLIFFISSRVYEFFYKYFYDGISIPLTFVISLACLLGISWLFYRFIDFYAIKWASKFAKFFWR